MNSLFVPLLHDWEARLQGVLPKRFTGQFSDSVISRVPLAAADQAGVLLDIKRCDLVHPVISGNKWYKLKFNVLFAASEGRHVLLSFGGAWSNHLHAMAYVAHQLGMKCCAVVRGDELAEHSNPTLRDIRRWGADICFVDRRLYRELKALSLSPDSHQQLINRLQLKGVKPDQLHVVPEGGDNWLGVVGASTMIPVDQAKCYDRVLLSCGTGCSLLGLHLALPASIRIMGFSALKGAWWQPAMRRRLSLLWPMPERRVELVDRYHFGGFGRVSSQLLGFIDEFEQLAGLPLDPVYNGKLMFGLADMLNSRHFQPGERLLIIHTGGLQGKRNP